MNIQSALEKLKSIIQDNAEFLTSSEKLDALNDAIRIYSKDKPREVTTDFSGDGSTYEWPLPSNYISGISNIKSVEYPADEEEPTYLRDTEYLIYLKSSTSDDGIISNTEYLRLIYSIPQSNEIVRIKYTSIHDLSSIPEIHEIGIIYNAASICFRLLAAKFAQSKDPIIDADIVDYRGKTEQYLNLAKEYEKKYRENIGLEGSTKSYTAYANWYTSYPEGMGDFLYHRRRYR